MKKAIYSILLVFTILQFTACVEKVTPPDESKFQNNNTPIPTISTMPDTNITPSAVESISPSPDVYDDTTTSPISNFTSVIAGENYSFGITDDGSLYAWGLNDEGCLGFKAEGVIKEPTKVKIPEKVIDVAPGIFTVVLTDFGNLYSFGVDNIGLEGVGRTYKSIPTKIIIEEKIAQLFNGHGSVGLAKGVSGAIYIWGWNRQGLLGNGTTDNSMIPQKLDIPSNVLDISCYDTHVIALCENGKVYTWGSNYYGELGDGSEIVMSASGDLTENNRLFPKEVSINGNVVNIAAARGASYALTDDGRLYAWGANDVGQLGIADKNIRYSSTPMEVDIKGTVKGIAIGAFHAYAVLENGDLYGWGYNSRENMDLSILGIGRDDRVIYTPVVIPISGKVTTINTGSGHTFMRNDEGNLYAWGSNYSSIISSDLPETVNVPTLLVS